MMNKAFISVVQKKGDTDMLTVRARVAGDIERVFQNATVTRGIGTDYLYRARVPRAVVAAAMLQQVMAIDYDNFKGSVKEGHRHDAYMAVWNSMYAYQRRMDTNCHTNGRMTVHPD